VASGSLPYLTPNDWTLINAKAQRRTYRSGEEIICQGTVGDRIVILRSGSASVEIAMTSRRSVLAELHAGDICGEMALLENRKTTAAVVARNDQVEVDEITYHDLRNIFEAFPRLASRFFQSLAVVLARRLEHTSRELAREMAIADRKT